MSASCVLLAFREVAGLLFRVKLEAFQQVGFDITVPVFAE